MKNKAVLSMAKQDLERIIPLMNNLFKIKDFRAFILISHSLLDTCLEKILEKELDENGKAQLVSNNAIRTFDVKILLCRIGKFVPAAIRKRLRNIDNIRNEFACNFIISNLDDDLKELKTLVDQFKNEIYPQYNVEDKKQTQNSIDLFLEAKPGLGVSNNVTSQYKAFLILTCISMLGHVLFHYSEDSLKNVLEIDTEFFTEYYQARTSAYALA